MKKTVKFLRYSFLLLVASVVGLFGINKSTHSNSAPNPIIPIAHADVPGPGGPDGGPFPQNSDDCDGGPGDGDGC